METPIITIIIPALVWQACNDGKYSFKTTVYNEVFGIYYTSHLADVDFVGSKGIPSSNGKRYWSGFVIDQRTSDEIFPLNENWFFLECSITEYFDLGKRAVNAYYLKKATEMLRESSIICSNKDKHLGAQELKLDLSKGLISETINGNAEGLPRSFKFNVEIAPEPETETE